MFDLFAGLGSASIAAKWAGLDDVATYLVENGERHASHLPALLRKKHPEDTVWRDVTDLTANNFELLEQIIKDHQATRPDVQCLVIGGFPCQDLSSKGKGRGLGGTRSCLFAHLVAIIARLQRLGLVTWYCAENVASMAPPQRTALEFAFGTEATERDAARWYPTKRQRLIFTNIPHKCAATDKPALTQEDTLTPGWTTCRRANIAGQAQSGHHQDKWRTFMRPIGPGEPPEAPTDFWHHSLVGYGIESLVTKTDLSQAERDTVLEHIRRGDCLKKNYDAARRGKLVHWIHQEGGDKLLRPLSSHERGKALGYTAHDLYASSQVPPMFTEADWHANWAVGNCLCPRMLLDILSPLGAHIRHGKPLLPRVPALHSELASISPEAILALVLSKNGTGQGAGRR